jgi:hypothetical protein
MYHSPGCSKTQSLLLSSAGQAISALLFHPIKRLTPPSMSYHEIELILSRITYNFDLELCPVSEDSLDHQPVSTLWENPSLTVKITVPFQKFQTLSEFSPRSIDFSLHYLNNYIFKLPKLRSQTPYHSCIPALIS